MCIRAVAFDIDGTLYPELELNRRLGPFTARHAPFLLALSSARRKLHALGDEDEGGPSDLAGFRRRQAELVAARLGTSAAKAEAAAERIVYGELEAYFARVRVFAGLEPVLDGLAAAGLRLAVLSDFPAARKLDLLGLGGRFELAQCSEESGRLKPSRRPFLLLAGALGLEPEEVLYVGNSRRYDVAGARAAGMGSALRRPLGRLGEADLVFSRWEDLERYAINRATLPPPPASS